MNQHLVKFLSCFILSKQKRIDFRGKHAIKIQNYDIQHIYNGDDGQEIVKNQLKQDKPCMICRFGGTEMRVVDYYLKHMKSNNVNFPAKIKQMISDLSGFFPTTDYYLSRFASEFIELTKNIDVLAVWNTKSEKDVCEKYLNKDAKLISLSTLDTVNYQTPWSEALEGKKVLVIHPFAETIQAQFDNREKVFEKNPKVLPNFELKTIKAVQGIADSKKDLPFDNWFEALNSMKKQIDETDFDIAIIGAGAYGIFLAHYCKQIGKQAVHMGGTTQLLFGITGKRWEIEQPQVIKNIVNEYWVRPNDSDTPKGAQKVEGGCYW